MTIKSQSGPMQLHQICERCGERFIGAARLCADCNKRSHLEHNVINRFTKEVILESSMKQCALVCAKLNASLLARPYITVCVRSTYGPQPMNPALKETVWG